MNATLQMPKRPEGPKPLIVLLLSLLLYNLPAEVQWIREFVPGIATPATQLPGWAIATMQVIAVVVMGGYATFLQWIDRRRYDEIFSLWSQEAEHYGFRPLTEMVLKDHPQIQGIVDYARKERSFILDYRRGLLAFDEIDAIEQSGNGLVHHEKGKVVVHPDLVMVRRSG